MKDMVTWVIVELTSPKGDHIPHEQEYNTRHGISAIPNEVCGEIRRQPRQPEVQQEPVVHLFLKAALGRKCGVPYLPVQTPPQSSKPAHGGRTETHSPVHLAIVGRSNAATARTRSGFTPATPSTPWTILQSNLLSTTAVPTTYL